MKIIKGNVFDKIKNIETDKIDLSITSPPYNKNEERNSGKLVTAVKYEDYQDVLPENEYQDLQIELLNEVYRITKPGGSFFYNHKVRWHLGDMFHPMDWLRKSDWVVKQEIIWNRNIAGNIRGWRFWPVEERIYWLYKPINNNKIGKELNSNHALLTSIWDISVEIDNDHPAPFPIDIPTRIIYSIMNNENGIVFDPYSGSGTTLLAAKLLDKDYLGIDISQEYIDMATKRIKNPSKYDMNRFNKELSLHIVNKTYKDRKNQIFKGIKHDFFD
jgi:modification methylase